GPGGGRGTPAPLLSGPRRGGGTRLSVRAIPARVSRVHADPASGEPGAGHDLPHTLGVQQTGAEPETGRAAPGGRPRSRPDDPAGGVLASHTRPPHHLFFGGPVMSLSRAAGESTAGELLLLLTCSDPHHEDVQHLHRR